jgi:hypothetical protein
VRRLKDKGVGVRGSGYSVELRVAASVWGRPTAWGGSLRWRLECLFWLSAGTAGAVFLLLLEFF